jgi:hypothetical protein
VAEFTGWETLINFGDGKTSQSVTMWRFSLTGTTLSVSLAAPFSVMVNELEIGGLSAVGGATLN